LETMARTLGLVCLLSALVGCAGTQTGAARAHATTAAALSDDDAMERKPLVRLRMEAADAPVQQAAFRAVRRTLTEQGFAVTGGLGDGVDADLLIRSAPSGEGTSVALVAQVGARVMVPVSVDIAGHGEDARGFDALSDLALRWQRRFCRSPRLDRHFEPDMVP
jgi:hypothetical protein